jgi:myo-inositol-1(or 4)-monophosphatase
MDEYEQFIKKIVIRAGILTLKYYGKIGVDHTKAGGVNDVVTIADLKTQELINNTVNKKFPKHGIIGEENSKINKDAEYVWYIDPIDGTRNYSKAIPSYGVMIALAKNDEVIMSAIYMPISKELYFAKKNKGAFLNNKRITCSKFPTFIDSNGVIGQKWDKKRKLMYDSLTKKVKDKSVYMAAVGSIAVASSMVSDGRKDWIMSDGGGVWDYAAPSLLLKESGCKVTNLKGEEWSLKDAQMLAANPILHKEIMKIIKE